MTRYKIVFSFIIGVFLCFAVEQAFQQRFWTAEKQTKPDIDYDAVLVNNCAYRDTYPGEVWLGYDLVEAFKISHSLPDMVFMEERKSYHDYFGIQVYLRGYYKFKPPFPDHRHINIAYMLYPLRYTKPQKEFIGKRDKIKLNVFGGQQLAYDELQFYDALAVASFPYSEKLKKAGFNAYYVPQFTNTQKFYYEYDETVKSDVLFVGAIRKSGAPVIALKYGLPITIYGPNWGDVAKGGFIDNKELHRYYSSAKIVLNDHRGDMRDNGFINNRTYDVTACGTMLISDYMPEIEAVYGDSVPMWKTEEELVALIKYYLDPANEAERLEKARRAQEITLKNFTTEQTAEKFKRIIEDVKKNKS